MSRRNTKNDVFLDETKNQLIIFDSPDKENDEKWYRGRDLMNFPHPFRCVLISQPGGGKTSFIKNMILRAEPEFKRIILVHHLGRFTREYDDVEHESMDELPTADMLNPDEKTLLILEDLNVKEISSEEKNKIDRLFGVVSSHMGLSIVISAQSVETQTTPNIRRCCNIMVLWKLIDKNSLATLARKFSVNVDVFNRVFDDFSDVHDSLTVDMTKGTPASLRKNGYEIYSKIR